MSEGNLGPSTLEGRFVRLEPLRAKHAAALAEVARGMDWGWMLGPLPSREDVDRRITDGLKAEERNEEYAFAVSLRQSNRVIGSTAYLAIAPKHKAAEIGRTWYSPDLWGTEVNPECKLLLLEHAFEDWGAIRVQLGTDGNNVHSQRAILKLGAKFEGRLRSHGIRPDGSVRDTMLYSIISSEWQIVKKGLEERIKKFALQHGSGIPSSTRPSEENFPRIEFDVTKHPAAHPRIFGELFRRTVSFGAVQISIALCLEYFNGPPRITK